MFNVIEVKTGNPDERGWDLFDGTDYIGFVDGSDDNRALLDALHLNNFSQAHGLMTYVVTPEVYAAKLRGPQVKRNGDKLNYGHPIRWESDRAGCIFDGANGWHNNGRVIDLARNLGMFYTDHDEQILDAYNKDETSTITLGEGDDAEVVNTGDAVIGQYEMVDKAIGWLNDNIAPAGYAFGFDDGFYLREIDDEDDEDDKN